MKVAEVQKLAVGTKVYLLDLSADLYSGQVVAQVVECEVREDRYGSGHKFPARMYTWRGQDSWRAVNAKWVYKERYQAEREMNARVVGMRDTLKQMSNAGLLQ